MGKSYTLSRPVLAPGAPKKVKNPLVVLGGDAASVVGNLEDGKETKARPCTAKAQTAVAADSANSGRRNRSTGSIGAG